MLKSIPVSGLLRKLRWSTLGLQFDWSKRNYNVSLPHNKIPDALCQLAKKMAAPTMPSGEEFGPEAAIVNYFGLGDTLEGHLDDMEANWTKLLLASVWVVKLFSFLEGSLGKIRQWQCSFKVGAVFSISFSEDSPFLLAIGGSKGKLEVWDTLSDAGVSRRYGKL